MYVREVPGSLQDADRGALILGASVGAGLAADGVLEVERDLLRTYTARRHRTYNIKPPFNGRTTDDIGRVAITRLPPGQPTASRQQATKRGVQLA
jgi:hypothetical protein